MKFAITGAAGYIAPRHMNAIKETGNQLVAALDPHDSVGILDRFGFGIKYFKEDEAFERFLYKQNKTNDRINFVSVCSPNYLHISHTLAALQAGSNAIVEKPLVINPQNLEMLKHWENKNARVYAILQMRYHPEIERLKQKISAAPINDCHIIKVIYITPRGPWYHHSWKGDPEKSGGLIMNIGVHLFDLLIWLFGEINIIGDLTTDSLNAWGCLQLERAHLVDWQLSVDPTITSPMRIINVDGENYDFSKYGDDLHVKAYEEILAGRGFGIEDAAPSLELVHALRLAASRNHE